MGVDAKRARANGRGTALQLKLSLRGVSKPPVWRRLLVPPDMRLDRLHDVIKTSMGWTDTHLHVFSTAAGDYGVPDPELGFRNERNARLGQFLKREGDRVQYLYDFGDGWEHDIVLEKRADRTPGEQLPACIAGKGACPPEDCGGPWGSQGSGKLEVEDEAERLVDSLLLGGGQPTSEFVETLDVNRAELFDQDPSGLVAQLDLRSEDCCRGAA